MNSIQEHKQVCTHTIHIYAKKKPPELALAKESSKYHVKLAWTGSMLLDRYSIYPVGVRFITTKSFIKAVVILRNIKTVLVSYQFLKKGFWMADPISPDVSQTSPSFSCEWTSQGDTSKCRRKSVAQWKCSSQEISLIASVIAWSTFVNHTHSHHPDWKYSDVTVFSVLS